MEILFKAILFPILLAFAAAVVEFIVSLFRGRSIGDFKYLIWKQEQKQIKEEKTNNNISFTLIRPVHNQSLQEIKEALDKGFVFEIEPMPKLDIVTFSTISIDLVIGALAVDIAPSKLDPDTTKTLFVIHFLAFICVLCLVTRIKIANPAEKMRLESISAILIGLVAMIIALLATLITNEAQK